MIVSSTSFLWPLIDPILVRALEEDLAGGDLTSEACVDSSLQAKAQLVARSEIVLAGAAIAARVFQLVTSSQHLTITTNNKEGDILSANTCFLELEGSARALLMAERVALNFVQRLSGIATMTKRFVDAVPKGYSTRITDTRKTTPGLRILERYAVRCGGGYNHRDMLGSAIMIKDNHRIAAGGITHAVQQVKQNAPHTSRIECEVESFEQLDEALCAGVDIVLLDNMNDTQTAQAVGQVRTYEKRTGKQVWVEASGNITFERVPFLAQCGVDVLSVGALTHSVKAADIALDLKILNS